MMTTDGGRDDDWFVDLYGPARESLLIAGRWSGEARREAGGL